MPKILDKVQLLTSAAKFVQHYFFINLYSIGNSVMHNRLIHYSHVDDFKCENTTVHASV